MVRAVEFIHSKAPEKAYPVGGEIPPLSSKRQVASRFESLLRPLQSTITYYMEKQCEVLRGLTEIKQLLIATSCASVVVGCTTGFLMYSYLNMHHKRNRQKRPYVYGTAVDRVEPGLGLNLLNGEPVPAEPPLDEVLLEHSDDSWPLRRPEAVDVGPSLQRRKQYQGQDEAGNYKWKDFPRDNNSDNGPNRVYRYSTQLYKLPRLAFMGIMTEQFISFQTHKPVTWGSYCMYEKDHVLVELPQDTVENLKKWWATVGLCDENIPISFVKANELTRSLALTAVDNNTVVILSACVALLSVKEFNVFNTIHHCETVMAGKYRSPYRTVNLNYHHFQDLLTVDSFRVLLSVTTGVVCCMLNFGLVIFSRF